MGRVRSVDRIILLPNGRTRRVKSRILAPRPTSQCVYYMVALCRDGESENRYIHRLVAEAFIPNPIGLPEINHKNGDHSNNSVSNLEWCTHSQNSVHKIYVLRKGGARMIRNDIGET